jgi:hypothetical protein
MTRRERRRPNGEERRSHRRIDAQHLPSLVTHISGGARVTLLDLSQGGVRIESTRHMRPGQTVSVRFSVEDRVVTISAKVVRASVVRLDAEEVRYETGLSLSGEFDCDALQLALVERRRAVSDNYSVPDEEPEDLGGFTHIDDGESADEANRGWWLSGKRHRRHRLLEQH